MVSVSSQKQGVCKYHTFFAPETSHRLEKRKKMSMRMPPALQITNSNITYAQFVWEATAAVNGKDIDEPNNPTRKRIRSIADAPCYHAVMSPHTEQIQKAKVNGNEKKRETRHRRTSVEIPYTIYLFSTNPCCPANCTVTFSCLFHHPDGNPLPETLDGGATPPTPPPPLIPPTPNGDALAPAPAPP
jgi:hypothetical protein